jgi:hypothetical protein
VPTRQMPAALRMLTIDGQAAGERAQRRGIISPPLRERPCAYWLDFPLVKVSFWLPRCCIQPPASLLKTIFPEVDHWLEKSQKDEVERDIAGQSFLKCLKELRVVILQDSIIMKKRFPEHLLWRSKEFRTDAFLEYERECNSVEVQPARPSGSPAGTSYAKNGRSSTIWICWKTICRPIERPPLGPQAGLMCQHLGLGPSLTPRDTHYINVGEVVRDESSF